MSQSGSILDNTAVVQLPSESDLSEALRRPQALLEAMQVRLSSPAVQEWLAARRQSMRPWLQFVNVSNFEKPETLPKWSRRLVKNFAHFQTNYVMVCLLLLLYCLLTSPFLLVAMAAVAGGCHILKLRQAEKKLVLAGREVPLPQQYAAVGFLSVPILLMAGASAALFWVIGASFVVIMLHATFFKSEAISGSEEEAELFEVTMDPM